MTVFNLVLANGRILKGCGNPWFRGDLAIQTGRIVEIAPPGTLRGQEIIDVADRFVSPGFIDIHTHSDLSILVNRRAESAVRQGVTTQVIGNCGMSPAPVEENHIADMHNYWGPISDQPEVNWDWRSFDGYLRTLQSGGLAINIASLAGHAALRIAVMDFEERDPTPSELDRMKEYLNEAMQAGAFGLSTGLVYPPGCYASTSEIITLCQVVSRYHGLYASHIRGERETILEAVAEAIHIGREAGVPVQISHNAPKFGAPWDANSNLRLVDEARAHGQDVTVDNDVHTDLAPALTGGLPQHIQELPAAEIVTLLQDPNTRSRVREEIIFDYIDETNIRILLKHPAVMICSDGQVLAPYGFLNDPSPYSPCSYGEFPGVLERYVRNEPVLLLEEAIRKMTSFPAQRFELMDRGVLRAGAWADIIVFDLERIRDRATNLYPHTYPFVNYPHRYPEGIDYVFVNGELVVDGEQHTDKLPGRVLRHPVGAYLYSDKRSSRQS